MISSMHRDTIWRALWVSRALVWAAGVGAVLTVGRSPRWVEFDPAGLTAPFGPAGDVLVAPAARWDSVWYLAIALGGYGEEATRTAFFPLYPLLVRVVGAPGALVADDLAAYLLAGIAVSLAAFAAGLYVVHRLTALELGEDVARTTVWLVALFPTAFAFSAVYTESLFLALSAGSLYAARLGRWRIAALAGLAAAATRSTGVLLVVPLALVWWQGDREVRRLLWIAAVPAGLAAYLAYLGLATGDPWAPFEVQDAWYRELAGPLGGAWDGATAAWDGLRQLASGSREPVYFEIAAGDPFVVAAHNVGNFAFLAFALVALVGAFRRLALPYASWALLCVAVPVSYPVAPEPLASLPRYLAVAFPLHMWLALWARRHGWERWVMAASALGLVALTVPFAAWEWVA
jgi:mannosyltransferase PIG-V